MAAPNILQAARINAIIQGLQDVREIPAELSFLNRTPVVPADDGEIMGRFVGRLQIADIIADDQQAVPYEAGKVVLEANAIPNLKVGALVSQAKLNQLAAIQTGQARASERNAYTDYENRLLTNCLIGVNQRQEQLIVAMQTDSLTYDRLGIKISGATWGMPSDLKVTPSIAWTDAGNATPVNDLLALKLTARVRYSKEYDRVTMSTSAFQYMVATTEFQAKARMFLAPNVSYTNLPLSDLGFQQSVAEAVLRMKIELYDSRYWSIDSAGLQTSAPYLPINLVVLSSTQDDNKPMVMDFANGVTTESRVAGMVGNSLIGDLGGEARGPIGYATAPADLNPPNVTYWSVARGFPRKWQLQATAVLNVGSFSNQISVGVPF